jgi:hypothetical protein
MRRVTMFGQRLLAGGGGLLLAAVSARLLLAAPGTRSWNFEGASKDAPPAGFSFARTGEGRRGVWKVVEQTGAPSGKAVLVQVDTDETDYRFPIAIASGLQARNLRVTVKCKTTDGKVDQAGGLVFRYKDENSYYVARLNALENNVRIYHVQDGRRIQFAGWNGKVTKNAWHDLTVEARDDRFQVFFDGKRVIDTTDRTIGEAGRIGLWTKADSVTYFDDLSITSLD